MRKYRPPKPNELNVNQTSIETENKTLRTPCPQVLLSNVNIITKAFVMFSCIIHYEPDDLMASLIIKNPSILMLKNDPRPIQ